MSKQSVCGKQVYHTPSTAEMGIDAICQTKRKYANERLILDYYYCIVCKGFHLTKKMLSSAERQIRDKTWKKIKSKQNSISNMEYTDETIITFGAHKGKALINVPAAYLIWLYNEGIRDEGLKAYVEDNMDVLRKQVDEDKTNYFKNKKSNQS